MSLSALIRGNGLFATAIPAIPSGINSATVARIATVAVAKSIQATAPSCSMPSLPAEEARLIRDWLVTAARFTELEEIDAVLAQCRQDSEARDYFMALAAAHVAGVSLADNRRSCRQCRCLIGRHCQAAMSGVITAPHAYCPNPDTPRRCEGYQPDGCDPDQRSGRERWPGLCQ